MSAEQNFSARARPWQPAPVVWLSVLVHAAALVSVLAQPGLWPWALGCVIGNHLLLGAAVLWPRGNLLGPNITRLPAAAAARNEVSLNFDDGPDPDVTPKVLDLLDRYGARASFFCIGSKAARFPALLQEIVRRGHSVENHTQRHSHAFAFFGPGALGKEVGASQRTLAALAGRAPAFFRAPAGFRSPFLDRVMAAAGLHYVSWTRRGFDTVSSDAGEVLRRLTRGLAAGDILLMHDGGPARNRDGEPVVIAVLPRLLEEFSARGLKPVTLAEAFRDGRAG
jgi:peptidoglycan/xylan/chitin deacetylase (PgdA/CDA1 family)